MISATSKATHITPRTETTVMASAVEFRRDGLEEIASLADRANIALGDIGARRLHSVIERLLESVAFDAPDRLRGPITVDEPYVKTTLATFYDEVDISRK